MMMFNDDEPIVATQIDDDPGYIYFQERRTKVRIINKSEAPLEEIKFKVMLEIMGVEFDNERPGLDLVTVLDISGSMKGERLEKMKIAMQLVIKKLSPIDRLSVVTFSGSSNRLCPLRQMTENSQAEIEKLVNNLVASGGTNISAGFEMGLKVLKDRLFTPGRVVGIMLLSDGAQGHQYQDAAQVWIGNVPVYTFSLGVDSDPKVLNAIANNSSGGTFKNVQNEDNLSIAFSQCLARLLTVELQDLKVTFKQVDSVIKNVYAGNYPQSRDYDVGSVTVSFGNLYKKEPHEVKVNLLLPDVSITQCADILGISYTYSFGGELIHTNPRIVTITRRNSAPMMKEARLVTDKQQEIANKIIMEAQKLLENVVDETLKSEVQQLKRLMNSQKLYNEQESEEVTIDEIHHLSAKSGEATIRSLEASTVHSNNEVKKIPIEFLLDRIGVRQRIPESLNRSNNYVDWSEKVKKDLQELNLWKVIEEPPTTTTESIENVDMGTAIKKLRQFRENWMALIFINQACGFPINLQIIDLHSAKAAWETLATNWKQGGSDAESFLSVVERGDWKNVERFLDSNQGLATTRIPFSQNTVLHVASLAGEVNIVEKLVELMEEKDLEIEDKDGYTALAKASIKGNKRIAQSMIQKNKRLVSIPTGTKLLPVVISMVHGHKQMTSYLYSVTPLQCNINGATLLTYSIKMQFYDISFDLIQKYPHLAVALDHSGQSALYQLACTPSAFRSTRLKNLWQELIYICAPVQYTCDINNTRLSVPHEDVSQNNWWNTGYRGIWQQIASRLLAASGIKHIYEMKLVHYQSVQLLDVICREIKDDLDNDEINGIINALHEAASRGVVEFIVGVLEKFPEFRLLRDKEESTIFMKAVQFRQADVFGLIHEFPSEDKMVVLVDKYEENILHKLVNSSVDKTSKIDGLIKIQNELKWFEEIKSMMPPDGLKKQNHEKKTAQQLLDESHKQLRMNAEVVMKETANSSIVVGILVITIMFTAAFTVPGGNNQVTGLPIFLKNRLFKVFVIADVLSLSFSIVSVSMCLGILTSQYVEKYLLGLLVIALSSLFFSLATMMVAFSATLLLMFRTESSITVPLILMFISLPVTIYQVLFFPLLQGCIMSTYGPSIFKRNRRLLLNR